ncbi:hypothetical protein OF117_06215 [Geodermatophilus sp. YIM 151500]|uniref:hypothetical protein n=1 Tax=Geodermatophilus sp. YIM 151500 TaxID=2984531 RepID=UPI0021E50DBF|nr:hypothetical protein [Geodermatophilus sp. YIM 151500]MCV2488951.1 hypothetical protein [Geodermatophilus sp. YIM 151500]
MDGRLWTCPTCDDVREFVQPPCPDGHTDDRGECPEWACAGCGYAYLLGDVPVGIAARPVGRAA